MDYQDHRFPQNPGPVSIRFSKPEGMSHRETREPGSDISDLPADTQLEINKIWTADYVAQWGKTATDRFVKDAALELASRPVGVKSEAERRVLQILSEYKQRNVIAKGLEMVMTHGPDINKWPATERKFARDRLTQWAAIETIRSRSNEIGAMDPIPPDYRNDKYWT